MFSLCVLYWVPLLHAYIQIPIEIYICIAIDIEHIFCYTRRRVSLVSLPFQYLCRCRIKCPRWDSACNTYSKQVYLPHIELLLSVNEMRSIHCYCYGHTKRQWDSPKNDEIHKSIKDKIAMLTTHFVYLSSNARWVLLGDRTTAIEQLKYTTEVRPSFSFVIFFGVYLCTPSENSMCICIEYQTLALYSFSLIVSIRSIIMIIITICLTWFSTRRTKFTTYFTVRCIFGPCFLIVEPKN